ncbi:MAG: hypothetical protein ACQESW_12890 [Bacteroidota bacterium]
MHVLSTLVRSNGPVNLLVYLVLLFSLSVGGCTLPRDMTDAKPEKVSAWDDSLSFQYNDSIQAGSYLEVTIQNRTKQPLIFLHPYELEVFSCANDTSKVRTLYCPCNASCVAPKDELIIPAHKSYTFQWHAVERWCETDPENNLQRIEKKRFPEAGNYFLQLHFKKGDSIHARQLGFTIYH